MEFRIGNRKGFYTGEYMNGVLFTYHTYVLPHPILYHATPLRRINVIVWPQNQREQNAPFIYNPL